VAIIAYIVLGDQLNFHQMVGIAIVISGLFLAQINWKRLRKSTPTIYQA
jgi:drug/metabolite transporter (DMT)-like permease